MDKTNLIDVAKHDLLHRLVLENLAHDTAISTANNENLLRVRMARQWNMSDHLLVPARPKFSPLRLATAERTRDIRELIALRALDDSIEDEDVPVRLGLEDEDVLVE